MKKGIIIFLAMASLLTVTNCYSKTFSPEQVTANGLTNEQAEEIVKIVIKHDKYDLSKKGMYIDKLSLSPIDEYIAFSLNYDTPADGATDILGTYRVNLKTGDIWEVNHCSRYHFAELEKIQKNIMKKTSVTMPQKHDIEDGICDNPPEQ